MSDKLLAILFLFLVSIYQVKAQTGTISVGPLLTCSITTFTCPGTSGCCTIGGCCGSGCCANGYACINEGTSDEACCDSFDTTKCGTAPLPSSSSGSGGGSGTNKCTALEACSAVTEDGVGWSCFFGQTCGFSYEECNPCPYLGSGGGSAATSSYEGSSPTSSGSSDESSPTSSGFDESSPTSSGSADESIPTSSGSADESSPTSSSSSDESVPSSSSSNSSPSSATPKNSGFAQQMEILDCIG